MTLQTWGDELRVYREQNREQQPPLCELKFWNEFKALKLFKIISYFNSYLNVFLQIKLDKRKYDDGCSVPGYEVFGTID